MKLFLCVCGLRYFSYYVTLNRINVLSETEKKYDLLHSAYVFSTIEVKKSVNEKVLLLAIAASCKREVFFGTH